MKQHDEMLSNTTRPARFTALHCLPQLDAEQEPHFHDYEVWLEYTGEMVDGMLPDYEPIEEIVEGVVALLRDRDLNRVDGLPNPTSELVILWILRHVATALPSGGEIVSLSMSKDGVVTTWRFPMAPERIRELGYSHMDAATS